MAKLYVQINGGEWTRVDGDMKIMYEYPEEECPEGVECCSLHMGFKDEGSVVDVIVEDEVVTSSWATAAHILESALEVEDPDDEIAETN